MRDNIADAVEADLIALSGVLMSLPSGNACAASCSGCSRSSAAMARTGGRSGGVTSWRRRPSASLAGWRSWAAAVTARSCSRFPAVPGQWRSSAVRRTAAARLSRALQSGRAAAHSLRPDSLRKGQPAAGQPGAGADRAIGGGGRAARVLTLSLFPECGGELERSGPPSVRPARVVRRRRPGRRRSSPG